MLMEPERHGCGVGGNLSEEKDGEPQWQSAADSLPDPAGAYSRAIRAGDFLYISGQVPRDLESGELKGADVRTQTLETLRNVRLVLEAAGAGLQDVVSVTAYLADINDWQVFDAAYREIFAPPYPTRTTVGAGLHGFLVEISVVAYSPSNLRKPISI